jgi:hypothetical protein
MSGYPRLATWPTAVLILGALTGCDNDPLGVTCSEYRSMSNSQQVQIATMWARPDPSGLQGPPWPGDQAAHELVTACQPAPDAVIAEMGVAYFGREQ